METKFNFKSQVCTSVEQSRRLLSLGLKKETADMYYRFYNENTYEINPTWETIWEDRNDYKKIIPAWSLHRLIEILDTNPCVFYTNCGYDNIIDRIEEYIKEGFIDARYMNEGYLEEE